MRALLHATLAVVLVACSSSQGVATDAGRETTRSDARADATSADTGMDATKPYDGPLPTSVLVRLANLSPDAPGVDFCIAPHATGLWTGPMLSNALGPDALGNVTVVDAGVVVDAGGKFRDSGTHDASRGIPDAGASTDARSESGVGHDAAIDARLDASSDAAHDAPADAPLFESAASDAQASDTGDGSSGASGVPFPRFSPYLSVNPGVYDVRIVAASTGSCTTPLFSDTTDLPGLVAGDTVTLATVGDLLDQGSDPAIGVVALRDDTSVRSAGAALRFVNAVPSVIETTLGSGQIRTANFSPILASAQFGDVSADSDAGALDTNGYLAVAPVTKAVWSVVNANGSIAELVAVDDISLTAGQLVTAASVGGESGPDETDVGLLVCVDHPPIIAGETATCTLLEGLGLTAPVCPACP